MGRSINWYIHWSFWDVPISPRPANRPVWPVATNCQSVTVCKHRVDNCKNFMIFPSYSRLIVIVWPWRIIGVFCWIIRSVFWRLRPHFLCESLSGWEVKILVLWCAFKVAAHVAYWNKALAYFYYHFDVVHRSSSDRGNDRASYFRGHGNRATPRRYVEREISNDR